MVNPNDVTEVVPYLTSAATIVYIQKWLKTRDVYQRFIIAFPTTDKYAHWFVAGLMSLIASAGIHYTWSGNLQAGGSFTILVPSFFGILHGISDWFKVYILQHFGHDAVTQSLKQNGVKNGK
jgi:hypothetical protein